MRGGGCGCAAWDCEVMQSTTRYASLNLVEYTAVSIPPVCSFAPGAQSGSLGELLKLRFPPGFGESGLIYTVPLTRRLSRVATNPELFPSTALALRGKGPPIGVPSRQPTEAVCRHTADSHSRQKTGSSLPRRSLAKVNLVMILPQVHLRKPCYDFYFL